MRKKNKQLRNLLLAVFITAALFVSIFYVLNRIETVQYILNTATSMSEWKIKLKSFDLSPIARSIKISGIEINNKSNGKLITVSKCKIKYRLLDILRGKIYIKNLEIDGVRASLSKEIKKSEKLKHLDVSKLFFIQNIILKHGIVKDIQVNFGKDVYISSDEIRIKMGPKLLGSTELQLRVDGLSVNKDQNSIIEVAALNIETSTSRTKWTEDIPFVNALDGNLIANDIRVKYQNIDSFQSSVKFNDNKLNVESFLLRFDKKDIKGTLGLDIDTDKWTTNIEIPNPVHFPYLGKPLKTINSEGDLSGSINAEGSGLNFKENTGKATANLVYKFTTSSKNPVNLQAALNWSQGIFSINNTKIIADNNEIDFVGDFNVNKKAMQIKAHAKQFPVEEGLEKFNSPHFKKLYGKSDFDADITGWGKDFQIDVKAVTFDGGYKPLRAEKALTDLKATYNKLDFKWEVYEQGVSTGKADLVVNLGKSVPDQDRSKDLDLHVVVKDHPVDKLLPAYKISGLISGSLNIKGPIQSFKGDAVGKIINGKVIIVPFDEITTNVNITRKQITFNNIVVTPSTLDKIAFSNPLTINLREGALTIEGAPDPWIDINIGYTYANNLWNAKKIEYKDNEDGQYSATLSGSIKGDKTISLKADGLVNLKSFTPLTYFVREASGPAKIDLHISGTTTNPNLNGDIEFNDCTLYTRQIYLPMEHLFGTLEFKNHTINFVNIVGDLEDGRFSLKGDLTYQDYAMVSSNLRLEGQGLRYKMEDGSFRAEFDGNIELVGKFPSPLLSGDITLVDAKYTKDFNLLETVTKKKPIKKKGEYVFSPKLNLRIKNTGDFLIKNNVGEISLGADLDVKGTRKDPKLGGVVQVVEGEIHYMGMNFDITKGFVELREGNEDPYLEVTAQKEIKTYNITAEVHGHINNLAIDLSATSPYGSLEKRDVISLLAFGITESEREQLAASRGGQFEISMAAQQLTHIIERPVTKLTGLDTFRLESSDPSNQSVSRVVVGKQISDRLTIDFTTDINTVNAVQTVIGEYLVTDNLVLKGARSTDENYEISGALRFRFR